MLKTQYSGGLRDSVVLGLAPFFSLAGNAGDTWCRRVRQSSAPTSTRPRSAPSEFGLVEPALHLLYDDRKGPGLGAAIILEEAKPLE